MKLAWFALFSMGTSALCQSAAQRPINPDKLFQLPDRFTQQAPQWGKLQPQPFRWNKLVLPPPAPLTPRPMLDNPQIDPKIIVRPPWHGETRGQNMARHLYPNLKFLPLQRGPRMPR